MVTRIVLDDKLILIKYISIYGLISTVVRMRCHLSEISVLGCRNITLPTYHYTFLTILEKKGFVIMIIILYKYSRFLTILVFHRINNN